MIQSVSMEELYSKKDKTSKNGPSELTIKRILAFSKALDASKSNHKTEKTASKED